jgi:hypothetical protein
VRPKRTCRAPSLSITTSVAWYFSPVVACTVFLLRWTVRRAASTKAGVAAGDVERPASAGLREGSGESGARSAVAVPAVVAPVVASGEETAA